jgi:hypothetical protein
MDGVAGFVVHHSIDCNIRFRMRVPASVFTAELAAIHMAMDPMDHIENDALERVLDLDRQYELDKGNGIIKNLATYPSVRVRV